MIMIQKIKTFHAAVDEALASIRGFLQEPGEGGGMNEEQQERGEQLVVTATVKIVKAAYDAFGDDIASKIEDVLDEHVHEGTDPELPQKPIPVAVEQGHKTPTVAEADQGAATSAAEGESATEQHEAAQQEKITQSLSEAPQGAISTTAAEGGTVGSN